MRRKPTFWARIGSNKYVARLNSWAKRKVRNFYEGAVRWSKDRSALPEQNPRDAREDLCEIDLIELIRKHRYWDKNSPLAHRLKKIFSHYTVGIRGQRIVPTTPDQDFNKTARKEWRNFCRVIEVTGKDYGTCSDESACSLFTDGGVFIAKTFREVPPVRGMPRRVPAVQMLERQQIASPPNNNNALVRNGIQFDKSNNIVGYWVREKFGDEERYTFRDKSQIIHIFDSERPNQIDGLPMLSAALNRLHDLDDLQILQMKKAKQHARLSHVLTTESGELPSDDDAMREREENVSTQDSQGNEKLEDRLKEYQRATGGEWLGLKPNEDLKTVTTNSPSATEQWHWVKTEAEVCATPGISRQLVFPESLQGTVARGDLEVTAANMRGYAALIGDGWLEVYRWFMEWAIRNLPSLKNHPEEYLEAQAYPPRGPNVDVGWNSEAVRKEIESGIRTFSRTLAELDLDPEEELTIRADEAVMITKLADERDLEKAEISILIQDRTERIAAIKADATVKAGQRNDPLLTEE